MHINDAIFLEDLCPKFRLRQWRKSIHRFTGKSCIYCGKTSELFGDSGNIKNAQDARSIGSTF